MLQNFTEQFLVTFAMTAWSLWRKRNVKLWEQQTESVDHVLAHPDYTLQTWMCAQNRQQSSSSARRSQVEHWQPPPTTFVKCNIDAAVFAPEQKATEAEAWGLLQGLEWIATLGYNKVILEMDYYEVVLTRRQANGSAHALARAALSQAYRLSLYF
ncbi:hypothetical protein L195_g008033 [Trifolium pratense]|uniref:RNase H type-1 domain-containing protein n=1 Tax=Trifolium pratense TaxID=57577 RepID=A0A2K3P819_TRIPR|nr:hypothetical protein L195_g008033 [Trifolium pratense]